MAFGITKKYRVGIDLSPAGMGARAPGTARHVTDQVRALFRMDVPWEWVPTIDGTSNPLYEEMASRHPIVLSRTKTFVRSTVDVGRAWSQQNCDAGFATAYFVPWLGCKVVTNFFDTNGYEFGWTWIQTGKRWNHYLNLTLSRYSLWKSQRLFINSNYCADYLRKMFPQYAKKICVTYCGVTVPMEDAPLVRPAVLRDLPKPFCLYVGVFSENKNQRRLIEAWGQWQRADPQAPILVLVGGCADDYLKSAILPERARAARPEEIILAGRLEDEEVAWCYRHASLYIQPSFAEGFGLPVIEAMSQGLPVALSRSTSLPEVGGDAAVYFDPARADSIAQVVRDLWSDRPLQDVLRERGKLRPALFTWEKNAAIIAAQIEAVLAGR